MTPPLSSFIYSFGRNAKDTIALGRTIHAMLSVHPHPNLPLRPQCVPWLDELRAGLDSLEAADAAASNHDTAMIAKRNEEHVAVKKTIWRIGQWCELALDGDVGALKATGYPMRQLRLKATYQPPIPAPEISVKHGTESATFIVKLKRVPGAQGYDIQITDGDPSVEANYNTVDTFPLTSGIIRNVVPGTAYSVRARVFAKTGRGPWSVPFTIRAL